MFRIVTAKYVLYEPWRKGEGRRTMGIVKLDLTIGLISEVNCERYKVYLQTVPTSLQMVN
jgi:hypothetical protein